MPGKSLRQPISLIFILVLLLTSVGAASATPSGTVEVQILSLNDFHGNLEPPAGSSAGSARLMPAALNI